MAKPGYTQIAEHFGVSNETIRDMEYRPGKFSKPVYHFADTLYAAGKTKPVDLDGDITFRVIPSRFTPHTIWEQITEPVNETGSSSSN